MSLYPSAPDVFVDRTGADEIASSDPNNAYDAIENLENFVGASGEAQSKSVTLVNMFRSMLAPLPVCSYIDTNTIQIPPSEIALFNGDNVVFKRNEAATTCSLAVHLLVGTEAANTWYHLYMYGDGATNEFQLAFLGQGTDPAVHMTYYRRINAVLNDSSGNITPFYQTGKWMTYQKHYEILSNGTQTSFTAVSATNYLPNFCEYAQIGSDGTHNNYAANLRVTGSSEVVGINIGGFEMAMFKWFSFPLNPSQSIDYKVASDNLYLYVLGWHLGNV